MLMFPSPSFFSEFKNWWNCAENTAFRFYSCCRNKQWMHMWDKAFVFDVKHIGIPSLRMFQLPFWFSSNALHVCILLHTCIESLGPRKERKRNQGVIVFKVDLVYLEFAIILKEIATLLHFYKIKVALPSPMPREST